jgi:hypothetical protein
MRWVVIGLFMLTVVFPTVKEMATEALKLFENVPRKTQ